VGYPEMGGASEYENSYKALYTEQGIAVAKHSLSFLQATLDATAYGIMIVDCNQKVRYCNCKFTEMWNIKQGFSMIENPSYLFTLMSEQLKNPEEYLEKDKQIAIQLDHESYEIFELKDGRFFERYSKPQWLGNEIVGRILSFYDITRFKLHEQKASLCIARDMAERKKIEKEMANLERMHLVGEMAAGIGHEVRNPMTTIRGFLQMLIKKKDCIKYWEYYKIMIEELDRANSIITEFLSLANEKLISQDCQNMNTIITSLLPLMEANAIVSNKYIKVELSQIPEIFLDENEIRQLILNLVRNSLDAMSPGGYLVIRTYIEEGNVVLAVKDQGTGIDPEVLAQMSRPFFTTKEDGTGLGLPICYNIASRHHAMIDVETSDQGTTFFVKFRQTGSLISKIDL